MEDEETSELNDTGCVNLEAAKTLIGVLAVLLIFVGYTPYLRDTIARRTHPHAYSWFLWALIAIVTSALQFGDGAGIGAAVTLSAGIVCVMIFVVGLRFGDRDITRMDTAFLIAGFAATALWIIADQPLLSVLLLAVIDLLAFAPTIRKSWNKPFTETLSSYVMNVVRFGLALLAIRSYTVITVLYPATWILGNAFFVAMLNIRRHQTFAVASVECRSTTRTLACALATSSPARSTTMCISSRAKPPAIR
jgi:hypothetical protein